MTIFGRQSQEEWRLTQRVVELTHERDAARDAWLRVVVSWIDVELIRGNRPLTIMATQVPPGVVLDDLIRERRELLRNRGYDVA